MRSRTNQDPATPRPWDERLVLLVLAVGLWALAAFVLSRILRSNDLVEYQRYAHAALKVPLLHAFPTEYPPPALAVFLLPLALPLAYQWGFAAIVGIALLALTWSYTSGAGDHDEPAARCLLAYFAIGAGMVLTDRYDIFAAAAAFWAFGSAQRGRWDSAWTWSSVGFLLKLFPAAIWPVLVIAEWREKRHPPLRRMIWVALSVFLIAGVPLLLNRSQALNAFRFYFHRPTEIGSLSAGFALVLQWSHWTYQVSFNTKNAVSSFVTPLTVAFTAGAIAACVATWWAQATGRLRLREAALVTLTCVVLGSKVLSPQYLIWLIPLWALYGLRPAWILAGTLNTAIFAVLASSVSAGRTSARHLVITTTLLNLGRNLTIALGTYLVVREVIGHSKSRHGTRVGAKPASRRVKAKRLPSRTAQPRGSLLK